MRRSRGSPMWDLLLMAAAVADFRPAHSRGRKDLEGGARLPRRST